MQSAPLLEGGCGQVQLVSTRWQAGEEEGAVGSGGLGQDRGIGVEVGLGIVQVDRHASDTLADIRHTVSVDVVDRGGETFSSFPDSSVLAVLRLSLWNRGRWRQVP